MAVFFGPSTPASIVTSGLVGYWDALNPSSYSGSGSSWSDLSGYNNTATLINSPTFNNDGTGSFTLNGSGQYIDMAPSYPSNSFPQAYAAMSISIWFKTSSTAANKSLFGIGSNLGNGTRMNMWISSQTMNVETVNDGIGTDIGTFSLDTWYNFAVVNSGNITTSQLKLYVNGVDHTAVYGGTNNWSLWIAPTTGSILIGTVPGYPFDYWFPGSIAIPLVYNKALSAAECLQNFNATRKRFGV